MLNQQTIEKINRLMPQIIFVGLGCPWQEKWMIENSKKINANIVHIATEGPLGFFARRYCIKNNIKFTTSLHTKFAEYINERIHIPVSIGYSFLRYFFLSAL